MTLFLDMDGVLADFNGSWRERVGRESWRAQLIKEYDDRYAGKQYPWDFWTHVGFRESQEFWDHLNDHDFWAGLEWTEEGKDIFAEVSRRSSWRNIHLLTHPPRSKHAYSGKFDWVSRNMPGMQSNLIMARHKHLLAGPDRVLIDDSDENVQRWREAGGVAVLIPRPWNRMFAQEKTFQSAGVHAWLEASGLHAA